MACNDPSAKASDQSNGVEKWLENVVPINCDFLVSSNKKVVFFEVGKGCDCGEKRIKSHHLNRLGEF